MTHLKPFLPMLTVLSLLVAESVLIAYAQESVPEADAQTLADVVAQREAHVERLRAAIDENPADSGLWEQRIAEEGMYWTLRERLSGRLDQMDPQERDAWGWSIVERIVAEWMARRPDDPAPYLALARLDPRAEHRLATLQEAATRFPAAASVHGSLAQELARRGEKAAASALLEDFVQRHPEDSEGFHALWSHHLLQGNASLADAALESWLTHHPSDLKALDAQLRSLARSQRQEEARAVAERVLVQLDASHSALALCEHLKGPFQGALLDLAADCFRRVAATAEDENLRLRALDSYGSTLAALGAMGDLLTVIEGLPEDRRSHAFLHAGMAMAHHGQCEEAAALFERVAEHHDPELSFPQHMARSLSDGCSHTEQARQLVLRLLGRAEPHEVAQIASSWQEHLPHDRLGEVLRSRLNREPEANRLWKALDELYAAAGDERRRAHLEAWLARHPTSGAEPWLDLANLLLAEGAAQEAVATLERAFAQARGDHRIVEALAGLLLMTGDFPRAESLVGDLLARDSAWGTEQALLLRARLLAAREEPEGALRAYDEYFSVRSGAVPEPVREYAYLLATLGRAKEAVDFLDERFREQAASPGGPLGGRDAYLAAELEAVGLPEEALRFWLQSAERAPEEAETLKKVGRLASELGRWGQAEDAYRRLIGLDLRNEYHWALLAQVFVAQDDLAAVEALAAEARKATGRVPSRIGYVLAQDALKRGDLVQAIRLLRDAQESNPYDRDVSSALEETYRRLGRDHE